MAAVEAQIAPVAALVDEAIERLVHVEHGLRRRRAEPDGRASQVPSDLEGDLPDIIIDLPVTGVAAHVNLVGSAATVNVNGALVHCRVVRSDRRALVLRPIRTQSARIAEMRAAAAAMGRGLGEE